MYRRRMIAEQIVDYAELLAAGYGRC